MTTTVEPSDRDLAEIDAALGAGDRAKAIDRAIAARKSGRLEPAILRLVAEGMEEDGLIHPAAELLERATAEDPNSLEGWVQYGRILLKVGQPAEAMAAHTNALALDPESYAAHLGAGEVCLFLGNVGESRRHYQRAAELSPTDGEPISALAVIAARQGDSQAAREFGERALAVRPDFVSAQIAVARADIMEGAPALGEARLKRLLERSDLGDDHRTDCLSYLADALDLLDRPAEAFALYAATNARLSRIKAEPLKAALAETSLAQARRLVAYFSAAQDAVWKTSAGEDSEGAATVAGHIFLMGFPRSGTTLLEQVLASHPGVVAIEERGMLAQAAGHFMTSNAGLERLSSLTAAGAKACREVYWRGVREFLGQDIAGKVFIDKLPLNTVVLPLIAKLFPNARILFALRDPRDVTLSCFRRRFRINVAMSEFVSLEGTARYYDAVMTLAEIYRAKLPLNLHSVRHEDMVADFDAEATRALSFIGVGWDPAVRGFSARARSGANTPSAAQLARGLNADGVGAWRRYERQLSPVLPILEPWVKRFGYPRTDPALMPPAPDPAVQRAVERIGGAVRENRWPAAFAEAEDALARGLRHGLFHRVRAVRAQQEGRLAAAIADFETALQDNPADAATLGALGLCLARNGRAIEGLTRLDSALAIEPNFAPIHYNRGWTLESLGDLAAAGEAYRRALSLDPGHAQALANLAMLAARRSDWEEARALAERALALDPGQPSAATVLAGAQAASGDPRGAEGRLRAVIADGRPDPHERAVTYGALGDVLDTLGRAGEAFSAYEAGAALLRDLYAGRSAETGVESSPALVRRLTAHFAATDPADWRRVAGAPSPAAGHVFLLGFPRSGTTLLGQALASHPQVVTLDEQEALKDAVERFYAGPDDLAALSSIGPDDIRRYQDLYWGRVGARGVRPAGKVFVDKLPMNTLGLPLIVKLFPNAKVVFMRRDPRDVALSCFRRQFAIDPTTVEFLTLAGTAAFYDQVMALAEVYRSKLELDLRLQVYEALVGDFEGETRALCEFLGLTWTPDLAGFAARAGEVATPSSAQLAAGLTSEGVGAWRRYREQMAPVMPLLAPWVDRFGYPAH